MFLFNEKKCADICLKNTNKYVFKAVNDLINDFERVSTFGVKPQIVKEATQNCIIIEENTRSSAEPIADESYSITTENGNIVILTFEILEDAPLGKTPISVSYDYDDFDIYDVNGEKVAFATQNGTVDVATVLLGDVNGDGIVNNYDRLLLTRWLAKWPEALEKGIIEAAADVNCDGKVNNLDRLILTRHLAHWAEYATLPYTK